MASGFFYDIRMPQRTKRTGAVGRPPKFLEPRRAVTMTLPLRILDELAEIDPDRTRAVVKITEAAAGSDSRRSLTVELVEMALGRSLIVVGPSKALKQIPWLKLIEIAPARHLLTIPTGTPIEALEVALRDWLHDPKPPNDPRENAIVQELLDLIGQQRRTFHLSKAEILIIDTR